MLPTYNKNNKNGFNQSLVDKLVGGYETCLKTTEGSKTKAAAQEIIKMEFLHSHVYQVL